LGVGVFGRWYWRRSVRRLQGGIFVAVFGMAVFVGLGVPVLVACIGVAVFVGFGVAVFVTGFSVAVFVGFGIEVVAANGCNALAWAPALAETMPLFPRHQTRFRQPTERYAAASRV